MPPDGRPHILAIDDEPDALRSDLRLGLNDRATADVLHPGEVELGHLASADLVLVDYRLTEWPQRLTVPLALQPATGLALAVVLRDHVDMGLTDRLKAFALHTAHLNEVRGRLPTSVGEHLLARLNNLEWAFQKDRASRWDQMIILAGAVRRLPREWPPGDHTASETEALMLLGLSDDKQWFGRARRNVMVCQPPIHDLIEGAHGLLFVRWLLHQIMPYPTFLWREEWVAARLRITIASLREIVAEGAQLGDALNKLAYRGILAGFVGERWWRAGLEEYVWNLTDGHAIDIDTLHTALRERTRVPFEALSPDASIVCLDGDLRPTGDFIAAEDAVLLRPDQWPAFADEAWTSLERARADTFLRSVVDSNDEGRVGEVDGNS